MKLQELFYNDRPILLESLTSDQLIVAMRKFLQVAKEEIGLDHLPKIVWKSTDKVGPDSNSFGRFLDAEQKIEVVIRNRHPIDIMRTLAHELVHYLQFTRGEIKPDSGDTGSDIENQANALAGQIMRRYDQEYPQMFALGAVSR